MAEETTSYTLPPEIIRSCAEHLSSRSRRERQEASQMLARVAKTDADSVLEYAPMLVEALSVSEAQTRWQCLEALSCVAVLSPEAVREGLPGAEDALFDELSVSARVAAFRFITRYGTTSAKDSARVWPIMAEALQCYHGDPEYREMLVCLREFSQAELDGKVRESLLERMEFDAKSERSMIRAYANEIIAFATGKADVDG